MYLFFTFSSLWAQSSYCDSLLSWMSEGKEARKNTQQKYETLKCTITSLLHTSCSYDECTRYNIENAQTSIRTQDRSTRNNLTQGFSLASSSILFVSISGCLAFQLTKVAASGLLGSRYLHWYMFPFPTNPPVQWHIVVYLYSRSLLMGFRIFCLPLLPLDHDSLPPVGNCLSPSLCFPGRQTLALH